LDPEREDTMKAGIHPKYEETTVHCSCGHTFTTRSTRENIRVDVCSQCHPFYTGNAGRLVDAAGQVERFNRRFNIKSGK
jgi:large subunit ribosomal protein L31